MRGWSAWYSNTQFSAPRAQEGLGKSGLGEVGINHRGPSGLRERLRLHSISNGDSRGRGCLCTSVAAQESGDRARGQMEQGEGCCCVPEPGASSGHVGLDTLK